MIFYRNLKCNFKIIKNILDTTTLTTTVTKRYLLKTTKTKLLNVYDKQLKTYINTTLKVEYQNLNEIKNDVTSTAKQDLVNRMGDLQRLLEIETEIENKENEINDLEKFLNSSTTDGDELLKLMQNELNESLQVIDDLKLNLIDTLVKDGLKEDQDNATIEIRAGVGGQEAMLFCKQLFEMYRGYAQYRGWTFEQATNAETNIGGFREVTADIKGVEVFKYLKFESGVHRVQRVPKTESSGRVHTSTVTVCILPKPDEIKIELNQKDLVIEPCRSRGPGGQHVNKTESACRVTHVPTGVVVFCQESRQHYKNRSLAIEMLKLKLYQSEFEKMVTDRERNRRLQVSSASRSERIRTYNYLQDRISDHRLDENFHHIDSFLMGSDNLNELIITLKYEQCLDLLDEILKK
jgi:peptide chain release factor 1